MAIRLNGVDHQSTLTQKSNQPIGTYHLADNPNLYEIQRSNNFEFIVTDLDGITRAGVLGGEASGSISDAEECLRLSIAGAFIPHFTQSTIEVKRGNNTVKFAGVPTFDSGSLTINDFIGADAKGVLMAWQNLSYNASTEKVGLVSDYKKDAYVIEYTPDYQKVRQWRLHGCWISSLSEDDYNYDSNDKHTISATIEYDRAEIDMSEVI